MLQTGQCADASAAEIPCAATLPRVHDTIDGARPGGEIDNSTAIIDYDDARDVRLVMPKAGEQIKQTKPLRRRGADRDDGRKATRARIIGNGVAEHGLNQPYNRLSGALAEPGGRLSDDA
jgi:hypothetical protein